MEISKGVVGMSWVNIIIVGLIALAFVWGYTYVQKTWLTSLPVV